MRKKRNVIEYDKAVDWDYKDQRQTEGPAIMAHVGMCSYSTRVGEEARFVI